MTKGTDRPIYLDYNATTPVMAEVVEAMLPYLHGEFGNPSSAHIYGRSARRAVDRARRQVAELIGASPKEVIFTGSGTESNNLAIRGTTSELQEQGHLVTTVIEHPSVVEPCRYVERQGWRVTRVGVDTTGCASADAVADAIDGGVDLVTIMHSNNETGAVQPLREIAEFTHRAGGLLHTDAAQAAGKIDVDVNKLGVDLMTIAGHKLYAPKGIGALYVRDGVEIEPVIRGAGHEHGLRPGTENVAFIVGFGKACAIAAETLEKEVERAREMRDHLWNVLVEEVPGIGVNGELSRCLPNTLNVRFPGVRTDALLARVPEIAASAGSACKEGGARPSGVLKAMGLSDDEALGSVRLSLGRKTTCDDVKEAARLLAKAWKEMSDV